MGLLPSSHLPNAVIVQTYDFRNASESRDFFIHPPDKRRIMGRLMPKLLSVAYGLNKGILLNGPFPKAFQALDSKTLIVEFDQGFSYKLNTSNSGRKGLSLLCLLS